ncbi:hypothetical protein BC938DRAFT_478570 [Jimgerdemannia flammicorona]|uniref:Uncharacterized protein n=1 Tax=Jimgerdemannia flammicorona TaxID=994334 RepID=A0A433QMM9_9FUNG|nr:hypothetical protein BC938DRAFT_478570 [Jimgerdemannia flammicorona]
MYGNRCTFTFPSMVEQVFSSGSIASSLGTSSAETPLLPIETSKYNATLFFGGLKIPTSLPDKQEVFGHNRPHNFLSTSSDTDNDERLPPTSTSIPIFLLKNSFEKYSNCRRKKVCDVHTRNVDSRNPPGTSCVRCKLQKKVCRGSPCLRCRNAGKDCEQQEYRRSVKRPKIEQPCSGASMPAVISVPNTKDLVNTAHIRSVPIPETPYLLTTGTATVSNEAHHNGHAWTREEDRALRFLVTFFGEKEEQWQKIASYMDDRTIENCRERFYLLNEPALSGRIMQQDDVKKPSLIQADVASHHIICLRKTLVSSVDRSSSSRMIAEDAFRHSVRGTTDEALAHINGGEVSPEEDNTSGDVSMPTSSRAISSPPLQINEETVPILPSTALGDGCFPGWHSEYPPRCPPTMHGEGGVTNNPNTENNWDYSNMLGGISCHTGSLGTEDGEWFCLYGWGGLDGHDGLCFEESGASTRSVI